MCTNDFIQSYHVVNGRCSILVNNMVFKKKKDKVSIRSLIRTIQKYFLQIAFCPRVYELNGKTNSNETNKIIKTKSDHLSQLKLDEGKTTMLLCEENKHLVQLNNHKSHDGFDTVPTKTLLSH